MKKNFINLTGFTLVEVMVVVFIITILVSITAISFKSVRVKGRDTKRVDTINTIHQALQAYYNDEGIYPTTLTFGQPLKNILGTKTYLDEVPKNPTPRVDHGCPDNEYIYTVGANNKSYSLAACIGADNNPNSIKMIYGTQEGIFHCGDTITDRDNFTYKTVSIGSQCWMAENLKTKTKPNGNCINVPTRCSGTGIPCTTNADCGSGYCYNYGITPPDCNWIFNGVKYASTSRLDGRDCITTGGTQGTEADCNAGRALYSLYEALQCSFLDNSPLCTSTPQPANTMCCGTGWVSNQNVQGLCPDGWHIPNNTEFGTLEKFLTDSGSTCNPNRANGTFDCQGAGAKLKALGGSSGFNAQLIGRRQRRSDGSCIPWAYSPSSAFDNPMPPPGLCLTHPPFPTNTSFSFQGSMEWFAIAEIDAIGSSGVGMRVLYNSDSKILKQNQNISDGRAWSIRCVKN